MIHRIDNGSIYCYYYCIQIPCTYFNFIHVIVRKYFFSFPNCYDKLHTYENAAVVIFQCNAGRLLLYWISVLSSPFLVNTKLLFFIWIKWRGVGRFGICWTPFNPQTQMSELQKISVYQTISSNYRQINVTDTVLSNRATVQMEKSNFHDLSPWLSLPYILTMEKIYQW